MPAVRAFFELYDSHGLPLDAIFEEFHLNGALPDWKDFWTRAMGAGWNPYTTLGKLREAVALVYDDAFLCGWEVRMRHCISIGWGLRA